jgi:hypothetical protein
MVAAAEPVSGETQDLALLRTYEPIVRFTKGELFLPIEVDRYIEACSLWSVARGARPRLLVPGGLLTVERLCAEGRAASDQQLFLRFAEPNLRPLERWRWRRQHRAKPGGVGRLGSVGILARFVDLFLKGSLQLRGKVPGSTVAAAQTSYAARLATKRCSYYARVVRAGGFVVLQYWYLYAMNDWRSTFGGINDHEADWEMACVYLAENDDGSLRPAWVAYSSHDYHGDDLRRRWDDPELRREGDHPVIFAGGGSHSGAFIPGDYVVQVEVPGLAGYVVRGVQLAARLVMPWHREKAVQGLRIPFIDYARGDGPSVGPCQDLEWEPHVIDDDTPWVRDYRGLWGLDTQDRFGGERAPSGPRYARDGSLRFSWTNPLAWAGLEKVSADEGEAVRELQNRLAALKSEIAAIEGEITQQRSELRSAWHVVRSLSGRQGTAGLQNDWRKETQVRERRLVELLRQRTALEEEQAAHVETLSRPLGPESVQAHVRHHREPYVAPRPVRTRLLRLWSALTVPVLFGIVVVLLVSPTGGVLGTIGTFLVLFLMVEAFAHRRLLAFLVGLAIAIVAFIVVSALVVAGLNDWRVTLAALLSAIATLLLLVNLRDLLRH